MYWLKIICASREGLTGRRERLSMKIKEDCPEICGVKKRHKKNESKKCPAKQLVTNLLCDLGQKEGNFSLNPWSCVLSTKLLILRHLSKPFTSLLSSGNLN